MTVSLLPPDGVVVRGLDVDDEALGQRDQALGGGGRGEGGRRRQHHVADWGERKTGEGAF